VVDGRRTVTIDGVVLEARITRKRVRHVNARLVGDELRVSAPHSVPSSELDEMLLRLGRRLVRRARAATVNSTHEAAVIARRVASRFPSPPEVTDVRFVTTQRARWGSYSRRTGVVRLHVALRELPSWVLEAVVAHELAHTVHADHSPAFWSLLREVCPETDRARAFLDGVSWISRRWDRLPPVERTLLSEG
jgi:predicted metal-dependent hydrolase